MALAVIADLEARLGLTFTDAEKTRADVLIEQAEGLVRAAARQHLDLVTDDVLTVRGSREARYLLPERPVVSVSKVEIAGSEVDGWHVDGDYLVRPGAFGGKDDALIITYTHGFDPVPTLFKAVTLEAVVRVWVNPGAVMSEAYGYERVQYTPGVPTGMMLTDAETKTIREFVRRGSETTYIR